MSGDSKSRSFSESLLLDDSEKGVVITGITNDTFAAKTGLQTGDEIVAATIHLDHLNKNEVLNILKVLEPYDDNMRVLTKKEMSARAGIGSLGLDLKDPAKMLNLKKDLSLDASSEAPVVSLDGLSGNLNADQGLGGEIKGPMLNGDLPSLNLNKPSTHSGAKFSVPSLGLTGYDIKGDLDGPLKESDVSVSAPQLNIKKPEMKGANLKNKTPKFAMPHFNLPKLETPKTEMDVSGDVDFPSVSGNLETPNLNLPPPKLDVKRSEFDLNGPKVNLNSPDVNFETPNADFEAPSGNIKWPHMKWNGPKVKGPDTDLNADLSAPDVSLSTPKIDRDLNAPDVDTDTTTGKINWPHLKWKKPKLHGPKADLGLDGKLNTPDVDLSAPNVEGGINAPHVDIDLPKAELKHPDLDLQTQNIDVEAPSGKINWPHLKWKKPKLQGPNADLDIDADLNTPDLRIEDVNVPNAELNLPKADLKGPSVDAPDLNIDATSKKINWPHLKWKKPKLHAPQGDMDLNADLSTPDVDLSVPNGPDIDLTLPKANVDGKVPNAAIEASPGKIKWPTLKKPRWSVSSPKINTSDVNLDADISSPDLSLATPNIDGEINAPDLPKTDLEGTEVDINAEGPSGKLKWFNFKKPKFGTLKGPKADIDADVKGPDVDLEESDVNLRAAGFNLSAPNTEGGIKAPDLNLKSSDVDLNGPDLELDSTDGKLKLPKLKLPNFKGPKVKGPELDTDLKAPDIDGRLDLPKVNVDAPNAELNQPDLSLSAPKIDRSFDAQDVDIHLPKANLKDQDVNIQTTDVDASAGKFKLPKMKFPKFGFSGPRLKGSDLDVDANLKKSDLDLSLSDVDAKLPKVNITEPDVNLKAQDMNLSAPTIEGGIAAPDLNLSLPNADLNSRDIDLDTPDVNTDVSGKLKMPSFKIPNFNIRGTKAQLPDAEFKTPSNPDVDLKLPTADVKAPNFNPSVPKMKGDLSAPDLDLDLSNADVDLNTDLPAPKTNIGLSDFNLSTSKIKGPNVDLPTADVKGASLDLQKADLQVPDLNLKASDLSPFSAKMDGNLSAPNIDTKLPKVELEAPNVEINQPKADLDFDSNLGDFKWPNFKLPKLGSSVPEVEVPSGHPSVETEIEAPKVRIGTPTADAKIFVPAIDSRVPKVEEDIKGPKVDVKASNIDANVDNKSKLPHFKLPKFNFSGSSIKASEVDTSANLEASPDVKVKAPSVEGEISSPDVRVSAPEARTILNTAEQDMTAEAVADVKGSPKSKLKWPFRWGKKSGSGTDEEGSGADSETDVSIAEADVPAFKFHRLPRNSIDGIGGIGDTLGLSKLETESKDYVVSKGIRLPIVNATPKAGEKIDIMERLKMAKEKAPSANVSPTEGKTDIDLKLAAPSLDVIASTEAEDSSLVRGGTFKVEKPESLQGLVAPEIVTSDENDKLSLSLSNMLGLNIKDSDAE